MDLTCNAANQFCYFKSTYLRQFHTPTFFVSKINCLQPFLRSLCQSFSCVLMSYDIGKWVFKYIIVVFLMIYSVQELVCVTHDSVLYNCFSYVVSVALRYGNSLVLKVQYM